MGDTKFHFNHSKQLPVESISWFDAIEYCNKKSQKEGLTPAYTVSGTKDNRSVNWDQSSKGYRLPTEAEWEYACRAGSDTPFNTGSNIKTDEANYNGNNPYNRNPKGMYRQRTIDVISLEPNNFGLFDMHGNVMEWCWDLLTTDYSNGAKSFPLRVCRGGSWKGSAQFTRSAFRIGFAPSAKEDFIGFRIALSI